MRNMSSTRDAHLSVMYYSKIARSANGKRPVFRVSKGRQLTQREVRAEQAAAKLPFGEIDSGRKRAALFFATLFMEGRWQQRLTTCSAGRSGPCHRVRPRH